LVVGAYLEDETALNAGAAYVYDLNSLGTQPTKLTAFDGASNDYFSLESVSINNGKVAISSYKNRTVYIYDITDLSAQPDTLSEPTKSSFGYKVEISPAVV
jgi:hypothetical protein